MASVNSKYKKVLINVYFGKFNNYFDLFLESCSYQKSYTFLIFTDDNSNYNYPSNVRAIFVTFEEIKRRLDKMFNFDYVLDRPYKLCDYKVAYGDIFKEYLDGFDYWGYCDLDVVFGNLDKICPDTLLEQYDKISERGHFALFKNTKEMREAYKMKANGTLDYKEVFSSPKIFGFDESWYEDGINHILTKNGYKVMLRPVIYADILKRPYGLHTIREIIEDSEEKQFELKKRKIFYRFLDGTLTQYSLVNNKIIEHEELYIHLLKRKMINNVTSKDSFLIVPRNKFINCRRDKKIKRYDFLFINENRTIIEKFFVFIERSIRYIKRKLKLKRK